MTLIEEIKKDQLAARKEHNAPLAILLTTLIGEAEMVGKNKRNGVPTDDEVQAVIIKFIKGNTEIINLFNEGENCVITAEFENVVLENYRPQQMSRVELMCAIVACAEAIDAQGPKDMGLVMQDLKKKFGGLYDGRGASTLVREHLNK